MTPAQRQEFDDLLNGQERREALRRARQWAIVAGGDVVTVPR